MKSKNGKGGGRKGGKGSGPPGAGGPATTAATTTAAALAPLPGAPLAPGIPSTKDSGLDGYSSGSAPAGPTVADCRLPLRPPPIDGQGTDPLAAPMYRLPYHVGFPNADPSLLLHRGFPLPSMTVFTNSVLGVGRSGTVFGTGHTPWREREGEPNSVPFAIKVWCVVCGVVWCVVCGVWCVVCGVWCVMCGV